MLSLTATIFGYYDACFDFRLEDKIENDDDSDTIYVDTNVVVDMNLAQALYTKLFFLLGILWSIDAVQVPLSIITFDMGTFFSSIYFPAFASTLRRPSCDSFGILSRFCDLVMQLQQVETCLKPKSHKCV